ncbi:MAG: hypothetical protein A2Y38_06005 [Spirochaetes bacterium GWB1_59_5]|nr:MAG: hypothetical protein A2Y38_06005 [Spirochaetes bacterium GWB1_59_5]
MSTIHHRQARIFVGGYELSGDHNSISVAASAEMLDETAFGDSTRIRKGGLKTVEVIGAGHWDAAAGHVDAVAFDLVGTDDQIVTVFADGITEGTATDMGFSMKGVVDKYNLKGDVGSLLGFDLSIAGRGIEA